MRTYDTYIDKAIFKILYEQEKINSSRLKTIIEQCSRDGKPISSALFSSRITQMLSSNQKYSRYLVNPVLQKEDYGRGKKIYYLLTNKARIRINFKLPILKEARYSRNSISVTSSVYVSRRGSSSQILCPHH